MFAYKICRIVKCWVVMLSVRGFLVCCFVNLVVFCCFFVFFVIQCYSALFGVFEGGFCFVRGLRLLKRCQIIIRFEFLWTSGISEF